MNMSDKIDACELIGLVREKMADIRVTRTDMCKMVGMSRATYYNLMNGSKPRKDLAEKMCTFAGIDIGMLNVRTCSMAGRPARRPINAATVANSFMYELRTKIGMSRREFSKETEIPYSRIVAHESRSMAHKTRIRDGILVMNMYSEHMDDNLKRMFKVFTA